MNYWMNLFSPTTLREFVEAGSSVVGYRWTMRFFVDKVQPDDILLCYLTGGAKEWLGALRVVGPSTSQERIWESEPFPCRLSVEQLVMLEPGQGLPMSDLLGSVSFYTGDTLKLSGFLRRSLVKFRPEDGALILKLLRSRAESTT